MVKCFVVHRGKRWLLINFWHPQWPCFKTLLKWKGLAHTTIHCTSFHSVTFSPIGQSISMSPALSLCESSRWCTVILVSKQALMQSVLMKVISVITSLWVSWSLQSSDVKSLITFSHLWWFFLYLCVEDNDTSKCKWWRLKFVKTWVQCICPIQWILKNCFFLVGTTILRLGTRRVLFFLSLLI